MKKKVLFRSPGAKAERPAPGLRLFQVIQVRFKTWPICLSLSLWGMLGGLLLPGCQAPAGQERSTDGEARGSQGELAQPGEAAGIAPPPTTMPLQNPPRLDAPAPQPPSIQGDRLWQQLTALIGQRHSEAERAATRRYLTEQLTQLGWQVEAQPFATSGHGTGVNLVATYPVAGSDPEAGADSRAGAAVSGAAVSGAAVSGAAVSDSGIETRQGREIALAAHYDTVLGSPGADDNGTGVALLLEVAQLYGEQRQVSAEAGLDQEQDLARSLRSLRLLLFDQEEQGLLGSLAYASQPKNLAPIRTAVVLDMLGFRCDQPGCQRYPEFLRDQAPSNIGDFIVVVGEVERPGLLAAFSAEADALLPQVFAVPVPLKGLLTPDVLRSDHAPFWLNGVSAVLITDTANLRNPHYHQPTDTLEQVDRDFFVGVSQRVVNGLWLLLGQP